MQCLKTILAFCGMIHGVPTLLLEEEAKKRVGKIRGGILVQLETRNL
jgi:hypothetical protein